MVTTQKEFRKLVYRCLDRAQFLYGVDFGRVTISFDLRGNRAALAAATPHPTRGWTYALRFNKEALALDWPFMVSSAIPHEIAHLVAFANPALKADNHNAEWRKIAIQLGDTARGKTNHTLALKPARRIVRYRYVNDEGTVCEVSLRMHKRVQSGGVVLAMDDHRFTRDQFTCVVVA